MTAILKFMKNIFVGLFSSNPGTGNTSQVGLEGSTGNGVSKGVTNLWPIVVIAVLVGVGCFFIGRSTVQPSFVQGPTEYLPGIPDTVWLPAEPIDGWTNSSQPTYTAELDTVFCIAAMPSMVETIVADTTWQATINIRATAYPWIDDDTLRVDQIIEYSVIPAPMSIVTIHDTLFVPVPTPTEVPWIQKPETVATGVSFVWLAILIILL